MSVTLKLSKDIIGGQVGVPVSNFFNVTAGADPTYLFVCATDRNEYTAGASDKTGDFVGSNGSTLALTRNGGDTRAAGILYTWSASAGQYENATYGALSNLSYVASASAHDLTDLSVFTTNSAAVANATNAGALSLSETSGAAYVGTASIVTDPAAAQPGSQATLNGIATIADSYVGDDWNSDGCWILAGTIAAEAGAALPIQSTAANVAGAPNGEWIVAYDGPVSASATWESLVHTGEIVGFQTTSGGGHITTCVSGSGSTAELVDNITYVNQYGAIQNAAGDGSSSDIVIAPPHPQSQEFTGVAAASVVIYELDTPVITLANSGGSTTAGTGSAAGTVGTTIGSMVSLAGLISASDPAGKSITQYQVYDSRSGANFLAGGKAQQAGSAATALTFSSLSGLDLSYGGIPGQDTVDVRASNGTYWGDWKAISVTIAAPSPPAVSAAEPTQTWAQGSAVSLVLPTTLFTDPQGQALTYSVSGVNGVALPSWAELRAATRSFSGTVPKGSTENFTVQVKATDTAGLSNMQTFTVTVPAKAPVVDSAVATQHWVAGAAVSDALKGALFTDPQGQALTIKASLASGAALPAWLSFNAANDTFSGAAPSLAQSLSLKLTAIDTSGLSVSETFTASVAAPTATASFAALVPEIGGLPGIGHALHAHG